MSAEIDVFIYFSEKNINNITEAYQSIALETLIYYFEFNETD